MPPFRFIPPSWLCLAFLATSGAAQADEKESWGFILTDDARLFYGIPESDAVTVLFICNRKPRRLEIVSNVLPANPTAGRPASITLRAGQRSVSYAGKFVQETDGVTFAAPAGGRREAFDMLRDGGSLAIEVAGKRKTVPLAGVQAPLAKMEAACFGK